MIVSNVCQDRPRRCFSTCCSPGPSLACTATPSPRPPNLQSRSRSRRRNQQGCLGSAATSSKTLSASTSSRSTRTIPTQTGFWAVRFSEARAIQASGVRRAKCCCSHPLPEGGSWTATGTSPRPETDGCFFFHRECGRTPARSWQPSTRASTRSVGEHHPGYVGPRWFRPSALAKPDHPPPVKPDPPRDRDPGPRGGWGPARRVPPESRVWHSGAIRGAGGGAA